MRIQNTEMEFISFDAQDVIATSGDFTGYYLLTLGQTSVDYNKSTYAQGGVQLGQSTGTSQPVSLKNYFVYADNATKNPYLKAVAGSKTTLQEAESLAAGKNILYATESNDATFSNIFAWLTQNNLQ